MTGAASGIGAEVARQFAKAGAAVMLSDQSKTGSDAAQALREDGREVVFHPVDVTDIRQTERMAHAAVEAFGRIDILVNCAGIFPRGTLLQTDDALWDRVMDVNAKGVFHCCRAVVPVMASQGAGAIVNVGSVNATAGATNLFAYATSKGAVVTLTKNLAKALTAARIRVNCVHPGWVNTEGEQAVQSAEGASADWAVKAGLRIPLGRILVAQDIAPTILFFASDLASQVTGQVIAVDGGGSTGE